MVKTGIYGRLKIEEKNGILTAKFKNNMKYAKLNNETLNVKEVESSKEVNGNLTEQQIISQGYKPLCEIEKPNENSTLKYTEYDSCIVQEWVEKGEDQMT